jgi:hypothetical protein
MGWMNWLSDVALHIGSLERWRRHDIDHSLTQLSTSTITGLHNVYEHVIRVPSSLNSFVLSYRMDTIKFWLYLAIM